MGLLERFEQAYTIDEFAQKLAMHYGMSAPRLRAKLYSIFDGDESAPYPPLQAMLDLADKDVRNDA